MKILRFWEFFPQGLGPPWFPRSLLESCFHHGLLFQFFLSEDIASELHSCDRFFIFLMFLGWAKKITHTHTHVAVRFHYSLLGLLICPIIIYSIQLLWWDTKGYKHVERERETQKKHTFLILHTNHYHQIIVPSDAPGALRISIPGWANDPMQCANVKLVKTFRFLPDKGFTK